MGHYKSNLRDIEFNLFEVLGRDQLYGTGPFAEMDVDTAKDILGELARLAENELAESFADADRNPPVFDPETNTAPVPATFKKSYEAFMDVRVLAAGPARGDRRHHRTPLPDLVVRRAGARLEPGDLDVLLRPGLRRHPLRRGHRGAEEDRRSSRSTSSGAPPWCSPSPTPAPTSAPAAPRRSSRRTAPGTSRASSASSPRASTTWPRTSSTTCWPAPRARGPGTKGLSLFIVPKYEFDFETGELGERNGVYATNVEHKMGLKASNTCEMTFGDQHPAKGWLIGDKHDGIRQMFRIIEFARMMVGTKAIATLSTGYLNALEYAKERVQGPTWRSFMDKTAPKVTITHHPDVRRSLMTQKAYAEGMRALVLYTASVQDAIQVKPRPPARTPKPLRRPQRPAAADREGLRLGEVVRAARPVAADLRRLRLPPGVPDRAVHPGRQDRHPLRGHHRDPGPGLLLPQDRPRPGRRR